MSNLVEPLAAAGPDQLAEIDARLQHIKTKLHLLERIECLLTEELRPYVVDVALTELPSHIETLANEAVTLREAHSLVYLKVHGKPEPVSKKTHYPTPQPLHGKDAPDECRLHRKTLKEHKQVPIIDSLLADIFNLLEDEGPLPSLVIAQRLKLNSHRVGAIIRNSSCFERNQDGDIRIALNGGKDPDRMIGPVLITY